jgi:post-segregation antitoxin (ccd killing protein)
MRMPSVSCTGLKKPVNLSMSEDRVTECRQYGINLSATVEALLQAHLQQQRLALQAQTQWADRCADDWTWVSYSPSAASRPIPITSGS